DAALRGPTLEVAFDGDAGASPQFAVVVVPHDLRLVVVAVQTQRRPHQRVGFVVAGGALHYTPPGGDARGPAGGERGESGRAWRRSGRQSQGRRSVQVCRRATRVWTGPNDGAVRVGKTAGWWATVSGTPLPPTRSERTIW